MKRTLHPLILYLAVTAHVFREGLGFWNGAYFLARIALFSVNRVILAFWMQKPYQQGKMVYKTTGYQCCHCTAGFQEVGYLTSKKAQLDAPYQRVYAYFKSS